MERALRSGLRRGCPVMEGALRRSRRGARRRRAAARPVSLRWAPLTPSARSAMAQFVFEADLHGLLKLDTPIPNAPPARWQRKAKESGAPGPSPAGGLSPMKPANRSHSSSKTPSRTPGKRRRPAAQVGRGERRLGCSPRSHRAPGSVPAAGPAGQAGGGGLR